MTDNSNEILTQKRKFYYAQGISDGAIAIAAYRPSEDDINGNYSELIEFREYDTQGKWRRRSLPTWIVALTAFSSEAKEHIFPACLTSQRVVFLPGLERAAEKLPDLPDGYGGTLEQIRKIDEKLYVCGSGGQIYRRDAPDVWRTIEPELLKLRKSRGIRRDFTDISGYSEGEIYITAREGMYVLKNNQTERLLGVPANLMSMYVESEACVWVCGWDGNVLKGNWKDGFRRVGFNPINRQMFTSITKFQSVVYLGSSGALYAYKDSEIYRVNLESVGSPMIHQVFVVGNALWGVGESSVIHFDGDTWTDMRYPQN